MVSLYSFLTGPMFWISVAVFLAGIIFKLIRMLILVKEKEAFILSYLSLKYGLRSVLHWIIPFASSNMRQHPIMTLAAFSFHICLLVTPLFLLAHIILIDEAINISYWALPDALADLMTIIVIGGCLFFMVRRIIKPEVRFVTTYSDYLFLFIIALPFITGLWAASQLPGYSYVLLLHIFSGELMLILIPFTRLVHMVFALFTRFYMGSEFGGVRFARDW
ncbi:TmcC family electron transfer complex membrane anchor subunit [Thermodesulfobacteriota bacterium]